MDSYDNMAVDDNLDINSAKIKPDSDVHFASTSLSVHEAADLLLPEYTAIRPC